MSSAIIYKTKACCTAYTWMAYTMDSCYLYSKIIKHDGSVILPSSYLYSYCSLYLPLQSYHAGWDWAASKLVSSCWHLTSTFSVLPVTSAHNPSIDIINDHHLMASKPSTLPHHLRYQDVSVADCLLDTIEMTDRKIEQLYLDDDNGQPYPFQLVRHSTGWYVPPRCSVEGNVKPGWLVAPPALHKWIPYHQPHSQELAGHPHRIGYAWGH